MTTATQTVREIAQTQPSSIRVFEQFGIEYLAARVVNRHGGTNPELALIRAKVAELAEELTEHLEEIFVFPMIVNLEQKNRSVRQQSSQSPTSIGNPIALLVQDHDHAGVLLAEIRSLSRNFTVPGYACSTFRAFYDGLKDFEPNLHRHVHLENNILFPRAIKLEVAL